MKQIFTVARYTTMLAVMIFCVTNAFSMNLDLQKQKRITTVLRNFKQLQNQEPCKAHLDQSKKIRQGFLMFLDNSEKEHIGIVKYFGI